MDEAKAFLFNLINNLDIKDDEYDKAYDLYKKARNSMLDYRAKGQVPFNVQTGVITAKMLMNEAYIRYVEKIMVDKFGDDGKQVVDAWVQGDYYEELENDD